MWRGDFTYSEWTLQHGFRANRDSKAGSKIVGFPITFCATIIDTDKDVSASKEDDNKDVLPLRGCNMTYLRSRFADE